MNCKKTQDLIPLYLAGMLTEKELKELENHLSTCKECQKHLKLEKVIERDLADFFEEEYKKQSPVFPFPHEKQSFRTFKKIAFAIAATLILTISMMLLKNGNTNLKVLNPQIQTVQINSPKIQNLVFVDGKLNTKIKNLGNNVYLVQIQGGQND